MTKDNSTKRTSAPGSSLADQIADLLENPDTPAELHNAIGDVLGDPLAKVTFSREVLRVALPLALRQAEQPAEDETAAADKQAPPEDALDLDSVFAAATFRDARRIANRETLQSKEWDDEELGDLLALMYALTYCERMPDREGILYEVVNAFMPSMDCARKGVERMVAGRFRREGGAR